MDDGIVGDLPDESLHPNDIPPLPTFPDDPGVLAKASTENDLESIMTLFNDHDGSQNYDARDALSIAVRNSNHEIISFLLSQGVKPQMDDAIQAVNLTSYTTLEAFLNNGVDINQEENLSSPPLLARALHYLELTKWFLRNGARPNARCYFDITPLSIAAQKASFEVIKLLFDHGASTNNGSPLIYAVRRKQNDRLKVIQYLVSKGARINDVLFQHDSVSYNHFKVIGLGTPLHEAAEEGDDQLVDHLLKNNADPSIKDTKGRLPIQVARSLAVICKLGLSASSDTGSHL